VLGETLIDLARLLVGVDVQGEGLGGRVPPELLEPVARAGADRVGGNADAHAGGPQLLQLREIVGDRLLPEPLDPAAAIGGKQQDELDAGLGCGLDGSLRLGEPEVVELADGRVPGVEHLAINLDVAGANLLCRQRGRQLEHRLAPAPEVVALVSASQRALERVRMGVHEARQGESLRHLRILPPWPLARFPPR
jgi:hypothetical protein